MVEGNREICLMVKFSLVIWVIKIAIIPWMQKITIDPLKNRLSLNFTPWNIESAVISILKTCVYCNHCQPCPAGLDVGLINKYYDLARSGDMLAKSHYKNLSVKGDACIGCGHCSRRCPFHVDQAARMQEITAYFNE